MALAAACVLGASPASGAPPPASSADPLFGTQWSLGAIRTPDRWDPGLMAAAPVVAVIDSGVDREHPDLQGRAWVNPGEVPGNGIDDEGNGFVDDMHGWNFAEGSADVTDRDGHGTHVAGLIAATPRNGIGVRGAAPSARIMVLKACHGNSCPDSALAASLDYAVAQGARVSVHAYTCPCALPRTRAAIARAEVAGHLMVAAAGNDAADIDAAAHDPASVPSDAVVSVAATDSRDQLAGFSNRGASQVDLAAPGDGIVSLFPRAAGDGSGVAVMSGSSAAAALVAAGAVAILAREPMQSGQAVRARILSTVRPVPMLAGLVATGGVLDIGAAMGVPLGQLLPFAGTADAPHARGSRTRPLRVRAGRALAPREVAQATGLPLSAGVTVVLVVPRASGALRMAGLRVKVMRPGLHRVGLRVTDAGGRSFTRVVWVRAR